MRDRERVRERGRKIEGMKGKEEEVEKEREKLFYVYLKKNRIIFFFKQ